MEIIQQAALATINDLANSFLVIVLLLVIWGNLKKRFDQLEQEIKKPPMKNRGHPLTAEQHINDSKEN